MMDLISHHHHRFICTEYVLTECNTWTHTHQLPSPVTVTSDPLNQGHTDIRMRPSRSTQCLHSAPSLKSSDSMHGRTLCLKPYIQTDRQTDRVYHYHCSQ